MWILDSLADGAQIGPMLDEEPTPQDGEGAALVPQSALQDPPLSIWSAAASGFIDIEPVIWTKVQFKGRFTQAERIAIRERGVRGGTVFDPVIEDILDLTADAEFISPDNSDTFNGVAYLEATGVISAGRASEVLGLDAASTVAAVAAGLPDGEGGA